MTKKCSNCTETKPLEAFYKNKGTKDGYGSWCRRCDTDERREQRRKKKARLVEASGGKCKRCGYHRCLMALEFHHPDKNKEHDVSALNSEELALKEAAKCLLVCANCHREIHEECNDTGL